MIDYIMNGVKEKVQTMAYYLGVKMDENIDLNLGNIPGICQLLDATAKTCSQCMMDNTDPKNPALPRLRLVGGQFVRVPYKVIFKEILQPSFKTAKSLGYRGTYQRWSDMVLDSSY